MALAFIGVVYVFVLLAYDRRDQRRDEVHIRKVVANSIEGHVDTNLRAQIATMYSRWSAM